MLHKSYCLEEGYFCTLCTYPIEIMDEIHRNGREIVHQSCHEADLLGLPVIEYVHEQK